MECSTHGFTLHHVPQNSGRTGCGMGVLINDRVKLVTPHIASLWRSIGGSHWRFVRWFSGGPQLATAQGFFKFYEIKDNIINKPQKNYIILKCTINYNYLRHTIYSNMILLFKAFIFLKTQTFMVFK